MKRFLFPMLWIGVLAVLISPFFVSERRTRAEGTSGVPQKQKVSRDLATKVAQGRGSDLVRVIIQPVDQSPLSLDSTLEFTGSNIHKLKLFQTRSEEHTSELQSPY